MKRKAIYDFVLFSMGTAISDCYVRDIVDSIIDDVVNDVDECADPDNWNEDDIRLAVGRVLKSRMEIE